MCVVSLFDESGNALRPWAEAGYRCYAFDLVNSNEEKDGVVFVRADLKNKEVLDFIEGLRPGIILSFPPCTDLAVSGARHFQRKHQENPLFQEEAALLAKTAHNLAEKLGVPWMAENPVSVLATKWRKPDFSFHPWEYGLYLPETDVHPRWPEYIAPRDAYNKKTCIWCGNGFVIPKKKPVEQPKGFSQQHLKLGGKSAKTKQIRSETPRGFARAVFEANRGLVKHENSAGGL